MASKSKQTTDHDEIKRWVESHGGEPAVVTDTKAKKEGSAGVLTIDFPGYRGEDSLSKLSWDEFFQTFDKQKLAFLYQDDQGDKESRFFKLVNR